MLAAILAVTTAVPHARISGAATALLTLAATFALTRSARPWLVAGGLVIVTGAWALAMVPFVGPDPLRADPLTPPVLLGRLSLAPLVAPGFVAALAAPSAIGAIGLGLRGRAPRGWLFFAGLLFLLVLASGARGAMLATAAGAAGFALSSRGAARLVPLVLPLGTLALLVIEPLAHLGRSIDSRIALWTVVTWLSAHAPAGIGFGAFVEHGVDHLGREVLATQVSAHNLFFQTWADLGPIGIGALVVTAAAAVTRVRLAAMPADSRRFFIGLVACIAALGCTESVITVVAFADHATMLDPQLFAILALPFARWGVARDGGDDARVAVGRAVGTELG